METSIEEHLSDVVDIRDDGTLTVAAVHESEEVQDHHEKLLLLKLHMKQKKYMSTLMKRLPLKLNMKQKKHMSTLMKRLLLKLHMRLRKF